MKWKWPGRLAAVLSFCILLLSHAESAENAEPFGGARSPSEPPRFASHAEFVEIESALGLGFAAVTAETGFGVFGGLAVAAHGWDVATAGWDTMVSGDPQDSMSSQAMQEIGVPRDWANGLDAAISAGGSMGISAASTAARVGYSVPSTVPRNEFYWANNVDRETLVFRVWGDRAGKLGHSWTTVDPRTVSNYRSAAGLPLENSGQMLTIGTLKETGPAIYRNALPVGNNPGGIPEILLSNPETQVEILDTVQLFPPY